MRVIMSRPSRLKLPPITPGDESLGMRLARIRKERQLTQVDLAERIGIIQALVSAYERGKLRLHAEMLARFAKALEVSTDELLGFQPRPGAPAGISLAVLRRAHRIESLPPSRRKMLLRALDMALDGAEKKGAEEEEARSPRRRRIDDRFDGK